MQYFFTLTSIKKFKLDDGIEFYPKGLQKIIFENARAVTIKYTIFPPKPLSPFVKKVLIKDCVG